MISILGTLKKCITTNNNAALISIKLAMQNEGKKDLSKSKIIARIRIFRGILTLNINNKAIAAPKISIRPSSLTIIQVKLK